MAITRGPLMSLSATGGLAGSLSFARPNGRQVCKRTPRGTDPRTLAQQYHRTAYAVIAALWSQLTPSQKNAWNAEALAANYTTWNACLAHNLKRTRLNQVPQVNHDTHNINPGPNLDGYGATPGRGQLEVHGYSLTPATEPNVFCLGAHPTSDSGAAKFQRLIGHQPNANTTGLWSITIPHIPPGTWHFQMCWMGPKSNQPNWINLSGPYVIT